MNNRITNLEDFVKAYEGKKSDAEISNLLDIPIDEVKGEREKISHHIKETKTQQRD